VIISISVLRKNQAPKNLLMLPVEKIPEFTPIEYGRTIIDEARTPFRMLLMEDEGIQTVLDLRRIIPPWVKK